MRKTRSAIRPPTRAHYWRASALAFALLATALTVGVLGYRVFNGEGWVDAFLDASMILGGMGPVSTMKNDAAKIFAGVYALFSGLVFIGTAAVLVAPWLHSLLHRLHAEPDDES